MRTRLGDRLIAAREERFVGREAEQDLFTSVITSPILPFNLLFVHGPGGIGKTSLLRAFARTCARHGIRHIAVDARSCEPAPHAFLASLGEALDLPAAHLGELTAKLTERVAILIDNFEALAPLEAWLRDVLLPELPEQTLTVLAGRDPPSAAWRVDPGWQALVRVLLLRNLTREEGHRYLLSQEVPEEACVTALEFTHGHPLALSLLTEVLRQQPLTTFAPREAPDVVRVLLEQFVNDIPGPLHRAAIETTALLRVTTEALLCAVLQVPDAHELFTWLRDLSFVEAGALGLFPHDLAREALTADLRWRDPDRFALLHARAREYYKRGLSQSRGRDQQRILSDYIYLHRDNPAIRPFLDWRETGAALPEPALEEEIPQLVAMVRAHEGGEAAAVAAFWLEQRSADVLVMRNANREAIGLLMMLPLDRIGDEARARDPAIRAAAAYLARDAALRPGETATYFRFWMSRDDYQSISATQSLIFLKIAQHYVNAPNLAFTFFPVADARFWAPFCAYIDLFPIPAAGFEVGGRRYEVFGHDWRTVPPIAWLELLAQRELDHSPPPVGLSRETRASSGWSEAEFGAGVRTALRNYTRPRALAGNILLRSRLLAGSSSHEIAGLEGVRQLQAMLRRAAETLREDPRQQRYFDALHHAYFHPAVSQQQAARLLYVSFSTFRRDLRVAIEHVCATLWAWELAGGPPAGVARIESEFAERAPRA